MYRYLAIVLALLIAGCSTSNKSNNRSAPSMQELLQGKQRIACLVDDKLTLSEIKEIYKEDLERNTKKYNPVTKCDEYKAYIYRSLNKPIILGFDQNNKYVYSRDFSIITPSVNDKITWAKDAKAKDAKKAFDEGVNKGLVKMQKGELK